MFNIKIFIILKLYYIQGVKNIPALFISLMTIVLKQYQIVGTTKKRNFVFDPNKPKKLLKAIKTPQKKHFIFYSARKLGNKTFGL